MENGGRSKFCFKKECVCVICVHRRSIEHRSVENIKQNFDWIAFVTVLGTYWPYGVGCGTFGALAYIIWKAHNDELRIFLKENYDNFIEMSDRLTIRMNSLRKLLERPNLSQALYDEYLQEYNQCYTYKKLIDNLLHSKMNIWNPNKDLITINLEDFARIKIEINLFLGRPGHRIVELKRALDGLLFQENFPILYWIGCHPFLMCFCVLVFSAIILVCARYTNKQHPMIKKIIFIYKFFSCVVMLPFKLLQHTFKFNFSHFQVTLHLLFALFGFFSLYLYFGQELYSELAPALEYFIKKILKK